MHYRTHFKLPQLKQNSNFLNRHLKFSTTPLVKEQANQTSQSISLPQHHIYAHLLGACLQQCKKIQSRRMFDELPNRLFRSSKAGKVIHCHSLKLGYASKGRLGDAIVDLYAKCGNVEFAEKAFCRLEKRDSIAWNSILSLYSRHGSWGNVVDGFVLMQATGVVPNQFTYAIVLSVCARLMNGKFGKQVHCDVIKTGFGFDTFCNGSLIDMYAKCGSLVDARRIFNNLVDPDTVSWTAIISGYVHAGLPEEALNMFEEMQRLGHVPDEVAFVTVINAFVGLGRLGDAACLFSQMLEPNTVAWNVMISGHSKGGYEVEAIKIFQNMTKAGVSPTRSTLGSVLSAIAGIANLEYGQQVHAQAVKQGLGTNVYVGSSLINMYAKCQRMDAAKEVFDGLSEKNDVLWNALLGGYSQNGYTCEVIKLFMNMKVSGFQHDEFTYTSILSSCACLENMDLGRQLHSVIIKSEYASNLFVQNALVDMYAKCRAIDDARLQFELIRSRDHVSWNAIIVGYVQEEQEEEAFNMFRRMILEVVAPDEVSLASILSACANIHAPSKGRQVHCFLIKYGLETGIFTGSSLIDMYSKCGDIEGATKVFCCMPEKTVVSTNALIAGSAQTNLNSAVNLFRSMLIEGLKPSEVTFASLLDVCYDLSKLHLGRQIHCFIVKFGLSYDDEYLAISLLQMYLNSQRKLEARILFSEFPSPKGKFVWTSMISGYAQNDCCEEALRLYQEMRSCNTMPDQATFVSVLRACSLLASLQDGRKIHSLIFHSGFDKDELTGSALVDMYAKCGDVRGSEIVFREMVSKKDVITWNSMIVGYAKNGYAENALKTFEDMKRTNVKPDQVSFLGILTACSHSGMVAEGRQIFDEMTTSYGVQPRADHCACVIDLYGRWGFLEEAEKFIENLSFKPDSMIWAAYLAACRLHRDDMRGQRAAQELIELEPQNSAPYILLSNMFAASGNWDGVNSLRREMKDKGVKKLPGCSWIVVGQETYSFVAGDKLHPYSDEIFAVLKDLIALMRDEAYFAEMESLMNDEE